MGKMRVEKSVEVAGAVMIGWLGEASPLRTAWPRLRREPHFRSSFRSAQKPRAMTHVGQGFPGQL